MQFHRKKPSIINDKHVQTALSIGYVKLAEKKAREVFKSILDEIIVNMDKFNLTMKYKKKHTKLQVRWLKIQRIWNTSKMNFYRTCF